MNFKSLLLGSNTSLLIKIGTITINTFLPMKNEFISVAQKSMLRDVMNSFLENIFCTLLVVEAFSPQEVVEMLEVVVSWHEVR